MARLVIVLLLLIALVGALAAVLNGIAAMRQPAPARNLGWPEMTTKTLQNIAYALLILLMLLVVTGLAGGGA